MSGRRYWPRTLTARVLLSVVLVIIVVLSVTGALTAVLLDSYLRTRLDQQLGATATDAQVNSLLSSNGSSSTPLTSPQRVYVTFLDARTGNAIDLQFTAPNLVSLSLSKAQRAALLPGTPRGPRTVSDTDGDRVRLVALADRVLAEQIRVTVVVGLSEDEVTDTMNRVLVLEAGVGGGAVLVALVATAFGLSLSLRPLRRVTRTAQEVTAELSPEGAGLDRRVHSTDATTEVGQLAESFNMMLDEVQAQFTARRDSEDRMRRFLADASHELRTPLTSIRGYAELARLRGSAGHADQVTDDTMTRIEAEGTRMSRLVEDLLMLARGDDGTGMPWVRVPVNVADVVDEAAESVRAAHPNRSIAAEVSSPDLAVTGDPDQLLRAVRNLLTNAAVHTAAGPIRVEAKRDGPQAVIRVSDTGPGLPAEELPHVFERFWRADHARSRARGGSGLGLAIVAQIVHAHGGDAAFESSPQSGSVVTLRLPAGPLSAVGAESQDARGSI